MLENTNDERKEESLKINISEIENMIDFYKGTTQMQFKMINSSFNCSMMLPGLQSSGVGSVIDLEPDTAVLGKNTTFYNTERIDDETKPKKSMRN